jgi:hypothetical protein
MMLARNDTCCCCPRAGAWYATFWRDMSVEWRRRSVCAILLEVRAWAQQQSCFFIRLHNIIFYSPVLLLILLAIPGIPLFPYLILNMSFYFTPTK